MTDAAGVQPHAGGALRLRFQLDGGSNVNFCNSPRARDVGAVYASAMQVAGIGGAADVTVDESISLRLQLGSGRSIVMSEACYSTTARRNVLSESWLLDSYRIVVHKHRLEMEWLDDGHVESIVRENGLYFTDAVVLSPSAPKNETKTFCIYI